MQRKIQSLYNIEKSIAIKNKIWNGMLSLYCLIRNIIINQINKYTDNRSKRKKKWKKFNLLSFLRHKNNF
jgi:hypothetical protein